MIFFHFLGPYLGRNILHYLMQQFKDILNGFDGLIQGCQKNQATLGALMPRFQGTPLDCGRDIAILLLSIEAFLGRQQALLSAG